MQDRAAKTLAPANDERASARASTRPSPFGPLTPDHIGEGYLLSTLNSVRRLRWCWSSVHFSHTQASLGLLSP